MYRQGKQRFCLVRGLLLYLLLWCHTVCHVIVTTGLFDCPTFLYGEGYITICCFNKSGKSLFKKNTSVHVDLTTNCCATWWCSRHHSCLTAIRFLVQTCKSAVAFLCAVFLCSLHLHGFSIGTAVSSHSPNTHDTAEYSVSADVSPVINWWRVPDVPRLSPTVSRETPVSEN